MKSEKGKGERGKRSGQLRREMLKKGKEKKEKERERERKTEREREREREREKGKKEVRSANGRGSRRDRGREGGMDMERMAKKSCSIICFEQIGLGRR